MESYESKTRFEHRKLLEEKGIEGFLRQIGKDVYGSDEDYIRTLSIALAHFCFREGPIEGMHGDLSTGLTDARMKVLNKFMVNRLGLFFLLLSCEDAQTLNSILFYFKARGTDWDDPDLHGELERFGIDSERPYLMRQLLRKPESSSKRGDYSMEVLEEAAGFRIPRHEHHPDEPLRECPYCGSEVLHRDPRTWLSYYVTRSDLMFNKDVARAAGVPKEVVSELQKYTDEKIAPKRRKQVEAVAEVLDVPAEILLAFRPEASTIRCDECGASAPWHVWNSRSGQSSG